MRALAVLALCAACSAGEPGPGIDVDRTMACVAQLATHPRFADTAESADAQGWITQELASFGVNVEAIRVGDVTLPEVTVLGRTYRRSHVAHTIDPDLLASFGPAAPNALLVMAHYDSVPGSPGAVDNAAAACTLVELARVLESHPPQQPVILAWTADEEAGLVGAEALADKRGRDLAFAIALDLIGGDGDLVLNGASTLVGRTELAWFARAAEHAGTPLFAPLQHRVASRWWPQAERSDHGAFTRRGIRAAHLYNRGNDGDLIDLAYHSPRDVPERVHRASIDELGRLLRALVADPVPAHAGDGFWIPTTHLVVPRWALVAAEWLLALVAFAGLVARLRSGRERDRGAGVAAGVVAFLVAAVTALVVESLASAYRGVWLHAPVHALVAEVLVLAGAFGLATGLVGRLWPWRGDDRYLAIAIALLAVFGMPLLVAGAAEVAWIWLVPAALLAIAPRVPRVIQLPLVVLASLAPLAIVLRAGILREAAWNGFPVGGLPLAAWITLVGAPAAPAVGWWVRTRRLGPLGTLVLPVGCGLAVLTGVLLALTEPRPCSAAEFKSLSLACEVQPGVH